MCHPVEEMPHTLGRCCGQACQSARGLHREQQQGTFCPPCDTLSRILAETRRGPRFLRMPRLSEGLHRCRVHRKYAFTTYCCSMRCVLKNEPLSAMGWRMTLMNPCRSPYDSDV